MLQYVHWLSLFLTSFLSFYLRTFHISLLYIWIFSISPFSFDFFFLYKHTSLCAMLSLMSLACVKVINLNLHFLEAPYVVCLTSSFFYICMNVTLYVRLLALWICTPIIHNLHLFFYSWTFIFSFHNISNMCIHSCLLACMNAC